MVSWRDVGCKEEEQVVVRIPSGQVFSHTCGTYGNADVQRLVTFQYQQADGRAMHRTVRCMAIDGFLYF